MHSKHSLLHSTIKAAFNLAGLLNCSTTSGRMWMKMKCHVAGLIINVQTLVGYVQTPPFMEEWGHSLRTTGMNRQTGKRDTSLSHRIRTSNHFITEYFSQGWSSWSVTPDAWLGLGFHLKQWGNRPLTPAICPPANISWVWGNTLCWTEVGRALESSDLD